MGRQFLKYTAALIGLNIAVANASGLGRVFLDGARGGSEFVRSLQGRR